MLLDRCDAVEGTSEQEQEDFVQFGTQVTNARRDVDVPVEDLRFMKPCLQELDDQKKQAEAAKQAAEAPMPPAPGAQGPHEKARGSRWRHRPRRERPPSGPRACMQLSSSKWWTFTTR